MWDSVDSSGVRSEVTCSGTTVPATATLQRPSAVASPRTPHFVLGDYLFAVPIPLPPPSPLVLSDYKEAPRRKLSR